MKFTLSWFKDHLDSDVTFTEICDRLMPIALEVEHVDEKAAIRPLDMPTQFSGLSV